MPAWARASTSLMSDAFLAFTWSSSVRRSLIGSRRFFTHFLRAKGFTWPQNPSLSVGVVAAGAAGGVDDGCADAAGALCESFEVCCATAGITNAEASRATAHWLGRKLFLLI